MTDLDQAAILLFGMGESQASEILKHLSQKQVEKLISSMNKLGDIDEVQVIKALNKFFSETNSHTGMAVGSDKYIRNTLISAIGNEKATSLIDKAALGEKYRGLEMIDWQDPRVIAEILQHEHPQVIAVTLTHVDGEKSAKVIGDYSKEKRIDILQRITQIGPISPMALQELSKVIEQHLAASPNFKTLPTAGIDATADIVNYLDNDLEKEILEGISSSDEELATKIQERMFPFEKLVDLDDRSLQTMLRDLENDDLILALKGSDEDLRVRFFKNMSERAALMLKDDLEAKGPVQLSEVLSAQKRIVTQAQKLAKDGKIVIPSKGQDDLVM